MARRLLNLCSLLSLLLCLATAALGVRSYWRGSRISRYAHEDTVIKRVRVPRSTTVASASTGFGDLVLYYRRSVILGHGGIVPPDGYIFEPRTDPHPYLDFTPVGWSHAHIQYTHATSPNGSLTVKLRLPFAYLVLLTLPLPLLWTLKKYRSVRARHDPACPTCGYDLTANTSGTCPECGTAIRDESPRHHVDR